MSDALDPATRAALRRKYVTLRALRLAHEQGESEPPREAIRALAAEFPGALVELDRLAMDVIAARIAELERGETPAWAVPVATYHAAFRGALAIRRRFDRASAIADVLRWLASEPEPLGGPLEREDVEAILRPPSGRLRDWAVRRAARVCRVSEVEVRARLTPLA
ncbi:MAG: hypothetical protein AB7S26_33465 [Sandaracinaceae bacterium]